MAFARPLAAALLVAGGSALAVQEDPGHDDFGRRIQRGAVGVPDGHDPMSLQRGQVAQNATLSDMGRVGAEQLLEAKLRMQVGDCLKNGDVSDHGHASGAADPDVFNRPWTHDMHTVQDSEEWGARAPYEMAAPGQRVKVAFLMFANDHIDNEDTWAYWLEQASAADLEFSVYVHAYGLPPRGNSTWKSPSFAPYLFQQQVRTTWCQMWEAQMLLLEKAVSDSTITHFLMVSSDSVPVKPMKYIYSELSSRPRSKFCADDYWRKPWPRAETWSVLWRGDAALFVENKEFSRKHFRRDCEEETGWYFPLKARWGNYGQEAAVDKECIMFTNWKDGEKACKEEWSKNADKCNCPQLRQKSENTPAGFKHPVVYHKIPSAGFEELVRSPFWFARKISDGALAADVQDMLHENFTSKPAPKRRRWRIFR
mmetsp:Transcript_99528/g.281687  ORF Transcript_99528/g.281687 Transcript_99528/m.281687 type:complete len:425 (-) Transcript_99528:74-1348(-)